MPMIHITIKQKGQEPRPRRCHADATLFTCPFCATDVCKPRQYHQIMTHLAGHKLRAVEYGDHVIYSCNIGCEKKARHFHCCQCPKIYMNKGAIKKHLCSAHPIATCNPEPQPVSHPLQEPPSHQQPAFHPPPELPSHQQPASHPPPEPPSHQQPASHPPPEPPSHQQPASHPPPEPPSHQQPASHPPPEPPSHQQPASHPSPEPPSHQQSASHPPPELPSQLRPASQPQELDLQQAAPDRQELAASPAIEKKQISVQDPRRHITVKQKGQEPRPRRCHADATLFTCPFCATDVCKPRQYHQIMTHLAGHKLRAVEYGDFVIYSCNIGCGKKARHFHCCKCPKTYFKKSELKRHLCRAHPIAPEAPSLQPPAPGPLELPARPVMAKRKQISAQCPHCGLSLNSKNLKKHIERKHHEALHTLTSVLPAQCVDKKNGLYVVSESFCEPCTPIHVVKKCWGSSHKVKCEMDNCNNRVEVAQRRGLLVAQCVHLSSVDYTCAVAPSEDLSEHVLTEMVERKWIGDIRKKRCLKMQKQAKLKGATFTSLVTIGGPDYMYYISIYKPKVSHYSKLGRVLVDYNAKTNTWNCPCGKRGKSCLHKSIAKWCLYQTKKQLFKKPA
ncbi:zinc finger protein 574 isoform X2 [Sinocyclocheilus grahami]|uniref:zinc finger protein 574 isoform X2 n=1 Tax=Sinocyclocheilus grahami TaxID=75366 RepID=UPI0007AD3811|nr:PREDICTED: zinc finger protein 574-like isoform X2 [Sinocyclocheilus grahami]